jgi:hypothetical protein
MTCLPIVEHFRSTASSEQQNRAADLAKRLNEERADLTVQDRFQPLLCQRIDDAPTLHLDDLSGIPYLDRAYQVTFMQDRARLRAGDGDMVAACSAPSEEFERYCRRNLGLGAPTWLRPALADHPLRLASACWADRAVRRTLIHALRNGDLSQLHPHMGNSSVWQLAALLHETSRRPLQVIAPPPGLTEWVNDKLAFAETIERLFGRDLIPRTEEAANFTTLARRVRELAAGATCIGLKLPDSAGGGGNVVVDADVFKRRSLHDTVQELRRLLAPLSWNGQCDLLVGSWETDVVCAPSAQLWIPPQSGGPPLVEGLYEQIIVGREGIFVGNRPASTLGSLTQEIVDRCWLLALLYQHLGYVGRCSFDMILVGESLAASRLQFVECNGRWGGTSIPMMLMNRIFGDWNTRPYAAQEWVVEGLSRLRFAEVLDHFADDLFDVRSGEGHVIFYNPGRIRAQSGINVLALGDTWDAADRLLQSEIPERLRDLVAGSVASS